MSSEKNETRTKILKACLSLLEEGAGSGIRMSDIAKRAGVSRQALYLHFQNRADLIIGATLLQDEEEGAQDALTPSRTAKSGRDRLSAFVRAWCNYIPTIYPMARTILHLMDRDEEVAKAWRKRMEDMREGCEAAIAMLADEDDLSDLFDPESATDMLWTMISVRSWELLVKERGWTQERFVLEIEASALRLFSKSSVEDLDIVPAIPSGPI